jgi:5-methylphenazine-1-carboxylate 1-monooxygenase
MSVIVVGAGVGGLTLALSLHQAGIPCRVYEAADEIRPLGVGINLLPHACREFRELGLEAQLAQAGVETQELCFYNKYGQFIYSEPRGRFAGYEWPQFSIHRGDLQMLLLEAVRERLGADSVVAGHRFRHASQDEDGVTAYFAESDGERPRAEVRGSVVVGADGVRSALRQQLYPDEGQPIYSGVTMWRGVSRWPAYLTGASMAVAGWLATGKMIIYPIRHNVDDGGRHLINWLCEYEMPPRLPGGDWSLPGRIEDFFPLCREMRFDWLDIPGMVQAADLVLEYPMVDRDPLPQWSFGRLTLLGDAAHPMYPRGSNGAGQAVLDARSLTGQLVRLADPVAALRAYEADRLQPTAAVVRMNRTNPPDAILREVYERTGDRPFGSIDEVISRAELEQLSEAYKRVAGFQRENLRQRGSLV